MVVNPLYVLAPDNVHVPEPLLVSVPVPVPMIEAIDPLPEPVKVSPNPEPVMVPTLLIVKVAPLFDPIVLALPKVIKPDNDDVPVPVNAPLLLTPVPLMVMASAPTAAAMSNVAPDDTVVPVAIVPNAEAFAALNVPALTVVKPVYALAPDNVRVPLPVFVNAPDVLALAPDIVKLVPELEISIELVVAAVNVKARSVEAVVPVYLNVPPPKTKFDAAFVA